MMKSDVQSWVFSVDNVPPAKVWDNPLHFQESEIALPTLHCIKQGINASWDMMLGKSSVLQKNVKLLLSV